jgi:ABC-2 type transport system ATP-binding protein
MTTPVVEVTNLRKTYAPSATDRPAPGVHDVSFAVDAGEIFGILGPNGAGKTTAVECLAGLREADDGTLRVLGADPQASPERIRDDLGIQLQESQLQDKITVEEALRLYAAFYADPMNIDELLTLLDLQDKRRTQFARLSGGQRQRLSIALALVGRPKVAILDELTTGLDPAARRATWELVERVRATGVTILLVTHFMDEAERLCDRLVIIDHGRVVAAGTPAELIGGLDASRDVRLQPAPGDLERTLAALAPLAGTPDVATVERAGDEIEVRGSRRVLFAVVPALAATDIVPQDVRTVTRTLEDVFVAVTGRAYDPETTQVSSPEGASR